MEIFKHLLISRFNLPKRWSVDKKGNRVLDNKWLEERFFLFENFCLPSIEAQTNKNFEWWVFFDKETEKSFLKRINFFEKQYSFFKPKYERSYDEFENKLPVTIQKYINEINVGYLITTRLDNDDMMAKDTIDLIQKNFLFQEELILELPTGYTLELVKFPKIRKVRQMLNPFISLIEKVEPTRQPKTVFFKQHTEWVDVSSEIITEKPQWVQIIHEKNVYNRPYGELVYPLNFLSRFNYKEENLMLDTRFNLILKKLKKKIKDFEMLYRFILRIKGRIK